MKVDREDVHEFLRKLPYEVGDYVQIDGTSFSNLQVLRINEVHLQKCYNDFQIFYSGRVHSERGFSEKYFKMSEDELTGRPIDSVSGFFKAKRRADEDRNMQSRIDDAVSENEKS